MKKHSSGAVSRAPLRLALAGLVILTLLWVASAAAMRGRGLDLSDESLYLLSYRHWDALPRTVSGVQYLYGPVFEAMDYDVQALRGLRILIVLMTVGIFAWAFVSWIQVTLPGRRGTHMGDIVSGMSIIASAGVIFGWLPLTPGYNDVAILCSMALAATILRCARSVALSGRLPVLPALAFGGLVVPFLLAKWVSAGATVTFIGLVGGAALISARAKGWLRFLSITIVGFTAALAAVQIWIFPIPEMLSPMIQANRFVASSAHSPTSLLGMYIRSSLPLMASAMVIACLAISIFGIAILTIRRSIGLLRVLTIGAPLVAMAVVFPSTWGLPGGGVGSVRAYTSALLGLSLIVFVIGAWNVVLAGPGAGTSTHGGFRRPRAILLGMLLALPLVQALGTNNPPAYLAVSGFPMWMAVLLAQLRVLEVRIHRECAIAATAVAVVVCSTVGVFGTAIHPYRTAGYADANFEIPGSSAISGLRVSAEEARRLTAVQRLVGASHRPGLPVIAYDELPGIVLLLQGVPVGEAWISRVEPRRSAEGLRTVCAKRRPIESPIVFFDRRPREIDRAGLSACGWNLSRDFREVPVRGWPGLIAFLPRWPSQQDAVR